MSKLSYGLEDWETLVESPEDALEQIVCCEQARGESWETVFSRIEWPVEVLVYKPMDVTKNSASLATLALNHMLEELDELYSDPEGDATEPTQAMKEAAKAFADAVVKDYVSWECEPTGDKVTFTLEQAREMFKTEGGE